MPPFKIVENFELKRDLVTFLQNSVRDPRLQLEDMKVSCTPCCACASASSPSSTSTAATR